MKHRRLTLRRLILEPNMTSAKPRRRGPIHEIEANHRLGGAGHRRRGSTARAAATARVARHPRRGHDHDAAPRRLGHPAPGFVVRLQQPAGIVLGQALDRALGERRGIARYGHAVIPMDEARAACAIDVSGRPYCACDGFERLPAGDIAGFEHEAAEEFFRAVASSARLTLHVELQAGTNAHHMIEACFKAFARALREAVSIDPDESGVPSTKGTLT